MWLWTLMVLQKGFIAEAFQLCYERNKNYSSLSAISNKYELLFFEENVCQSPMAEKEDFQKTISFFNHHFDSPLVIVAQNEIINKILKGVTSNHSRIIQYNFLGKLNHSILNNIINDIVNNLQTKIILVISEDVEWKLLIDFVKHNDQANLFWIRIVSGEFQFKENKSEMDCTYEISVQNRNQSFEDEKLLQKVWVAQQHCFKKRKHIIRVAGILSGDAIFTLPVQEDRLLTGKCGEQKRLCLVSKDNGQSWKQYCCAGFLIDVASQMFKDAGYDWELYIVPDSSYGGYSNCTDPGDYSTCQWNGLVNELKEGRADVVIAGLTITHPRLQVIDFTEEIIVTRLGMALVNRPEKLKFKNWKFIRPMDWDLLIALIIILFTFIFTTYAMERVVSRYEIHSPNEYTLENSFTYGAGLTFQRDLVGKTPKYWSSRIISICYAMTLLIVMSTYTANLTASTVLSDTYANFKGMYDEKITQPTKDFLYGCAKSTSIETLLQTQPLWQKAYKDFVRFHLVRDPNEGMEKVLKGELDAYIDEYWWLENVQKTKNKFCSGLILRKERYAVPNAFGTRKNSKLNLILSNVIQKLKEKGTIDLLSKKWFKTCEKTETKAFRFQLEYFGGLVIILGVGFLFVFLFATLEIIYMKWRAKVSGKFTIETLSEKDQSFSEV